MFLTRGRPSREQLRTAFAFLVKQCVRAEATDGELDFACRRVAPRCVRRGDDFEHACRRWVRESDEGLSDSPFTQDPQAVRLSIQQFPGMDQLPGPLQLLHHIIGTIQQ